MRKLLAFLLVSALLAGCEKDDHSGEGLHSPELLLTQKPWTLSSAGFDDNKNGAIDPQEEAVRDCERDNTLLFKANGTGVFNENTLTCGGPVEGNFNWAFAAGHTQLDIGGNRVSILTLTENEFVYTPLLEGLAASFIITYRH